MTTQQKLTHTVQCSVPVRLLTVMVLGTLSFQAGAQEGVPPKAQPIVTAPAVNTAAVPVQPQAQPAMPSSAPASGSLTPTLTGNPVSTQVMPGSVPLAAPVAVNDDSNHVTWVLKPEQHPWPIHTKDLPSLSPLNLNLPSEGEAKLMYPGMASTTLEDARAAGVKYINNALSDAAQTNARNTELLNDWIVRTTTQSKTLNNDPWQAYQFWREARQELSKFRKAIDGQSNPGVERMTIDVRTAIEKITPVMHSLQAQELRMGWYNLLVQLRDGFNQYQTQVQTDEAKLLARIDEFLTANPEVEKPEGPIPRKDGKYVPKNVAEPAAAAPAPPAPDTHAPSKPVNMQEGTGLGGLLTIGGVIALAGWFFYRARDRFLPNKKEKSGLVEPK